MREIKFRVWDKNYKIMHCAAAVRSIFSVSELTNCDDFVALQYTELKDKNGVEIYEGDILKIESPNGPFMGKVVNSIGTYGVVAHGVFDGRRQVCDYFPDNWNDDYLTLLDIYWDNNDDDDILETVKVMGNRYENPELLEEEPTC